MKVSKAEMFQINSVTTFVNTKFQVKPMMKTLKQSNKPV